MKKVKITIEVPDTLRSKLNKKAKKDGKTASGILRSLIKEYVKK